MIAPTVIMGDLNLTGKASGGGAGAGFLFGNVLTAGQSRQLHHAVWYCSSIGGASQGFIPVLYATSAGSPVGGALLGQGPSVTVSSTTAAWYDMPFTSPGPFVKAGTQYCFALLSGNTNSAAGPFSGSSGLTSFFVGNTGGSTTTPAATWPGGGGTNVNTPWACGAYADADPVPIMASAVLMRASLR